MGLFDFAKDAGAKLFNQDKHKAAEAAAGAKADQAKADTLAGQITISDLAVEGLNVTFNDGVAFVSGTCPTQADREKIILMLGNTHGVAQVRDELVVKVPEPEAVMYTVKSGDSLSKIAKAHYGNAMDYPKIFEANRPMLSNPDKIYPGQVLRIPPKG